MIKAGDIYNVFSAVVPLYLAMLCAYASVRWWKLFTPEQCAGINKLVALIAMPLYCFNFIATHDPYAVNIRFLIADTLQKVVVLIVLWLWGIFCKQGNIDWVITLFSLITLPNTIIVGLPILSAMYGEMTNALMVQIVLMQSIVWFTLLIVMYEIRAAKLLLAQKFSDPAKSIVSLHIDHDVVSLSDQESVVADVDKEIDGQLHVVVKCSNNTPRPFSRNRSVNSISSNTPRTSNFGGGDVYSFQSPQHGTPRISNVNARNDSSYVMFAEDALHKNNNEGFDEEAPKYVDRKGSKNNGGTQDHVENNTSLGIITTRGEGDMKESDLNGSTNSFSLHRKMDVHMEGGDSEKEKQQMMPPTNAITWPIIAMVLRKIIKNPNTHASVFGLIWSLISFRWNIKMPHIIHGSITILSNTGLGMAMFSLGLFMALQPKFIACGKSMASVAMVTRFVVGPAIMAIMSLALGLRGTLLPIAIVQAALPQAVASFVFANEYKVYPDIMSTSVIFGMLLSFPVTILYYMLLGI